MNVKKPKIGITHKIRRPKVKKVRVNPFGAKKRKICRLHGKAQSKKHVKKSNNKKHQKKNTSQIREKIKKERTIQQRKSQEIIQNMKKMQTLVISLPGLEELSESSVSKIQQKRLKICKESIETLKEIDLSVKRLTKYEEKFSS